ncbi:MAG: beta-carotene 15,15'-dioxygenase, Brp/Blh family [Kineosporiaceae bacterium]
MTAAGFAAVGAALLATEGLAVVAPGDPTPVAALVAVVLVAVGSPHGAMDHVALLDGRGRAGGSRWRAAVPDLRLAAGYLAVAGAALVGYLVAPTAGFALFLVLSVLHFGAGEIGFAVERGVARGWADPRGWAAALGGGVVVVVPLASPAAEAAVAAVDPRLIPVLAPLPTIAAAVAAATVLAVAGCTIAAITGRNRGAALVAAELTALLALAWLAHPLLAFGAYFAGWHALRHQARLADLVADVPSGPGARTTAPGALGRVARSAVPGLPATAVVVATAVPLVMWGQSLLGALLALVWALTVPHSTAVAVMEVRRHRRAAGPPVLTRASGRPAA